VVGLLTVTENTADLVQQRANDLEKLLQIFVIAILAVMVLSVYLASTISTPISTLAEAMETRGDPEGG
jgi:type II secretory pathway component PulF